MDSVTHYAFRDIERADAQFLLEMLRLTVAWQLAPTADGMPPPVLVPPYAFDDLGRPGDGGVIVTYDGEPVGACWYRLNLTAREHDGRPVPEMSVAVMPAHRAHGIGGELLDRAIEHARAAGYTAIDLVVELANPARGMYERRGFEPLGDAADARDMRKVL
jgi:ribosomal protein S18 acetylase RimI-like enzyme